MNKKNNKRKYNGFDEYRVYYLKLTPHMLDTFIDYMIEIFPELEDLPDDYFFYTTKGYQQPIDDIVFDQLLNQLYPIPEDIE